MSKFLKKLGKNLVGGKKDKGGNDLQGGPICDVEFRIGDNVYTCSDCAQDDDCVICERCFNHSEHRQHRFGKERQQVEGGFCDCGDTEAFINFPMCQFHQQEESGFNPQALCNKLIQRGERSYKCLSCTHDNDTILCEECFQQSEHRDHGAKMEIVEDEGHCDCGDSQSFSKNPTCQRHQNPHTQQGYPGSYSQPPMQGYPGAPPINKGYPGAQPTNQGYPGVPATNQGYPGAPATNQGYPGAQPTNQGYPGAPATNQGYPGAPPTNQGYLGSPTTNQGYPGAPQANQGYPGAPTARDGYQDGQQTMQGYQVAQPPVDPQVDAWFRAVDKDNSGQIDAEELGQALLNGDGTRFSMGTCNELVALYDSRLIGTLDVHQFGQLFSFIKQKKTIYESLDVDRSGSLGQDELGQALQQMGYRFSPTFIQNTATKYGGKDAAKRIILDNFISIVVQVSRLTESFKTRDREMKGLATLQYEDFLGVAMGSHK